MRLKKLLSIASGVAVAGGIAFAAAPAANATDWVDCAGRNDFYEVINESGGMRCYANYGDYSTTVYDVITLSTGNNNGWVTAMTLDGVWFDSPYHPHWWRGSFYQPVIVYTVHLR
jgi:hypothetical protein